MNKGWFAVTLAWAFCLLAAAAFPSTEARQHLNAFAKVRFPVEDDTSCSSYTKFINDLGKYLLTKSLFHGIPQLRDPASLTSPKQKFLLVELSTPSFDSTPIPTDSITLAIDQVNAKVMAYRGGTSSYYFRDAPYDEIRTLFPRTKPIILAFNSSYADLERYATIPRSSIYLGQKPLKLAIRVLRDSNYVANANWDKSAAASLIIVMQMVSVAVRFKDIESQVCKHFDSRQHFLPDAYMLSLDDSWVELSTQVQRSNQGVFDHPIRLQSAASNATSFEFGNVRDVIPNLALMLFVCRDQTSKYQTSPLLIKSVVDKQNAGSDSADGSCTISEPTVHISGRDGLCADIRDGDYKDGNQIQSWPCTTGANQLWTIQRDGTIRSKGKCLTAYGYNPGQYVMIYSCETADADATHWQILDDGTIMNPKSGLVLSAESRSRGTTLTLQNNEYAAMQGWLPSVNLKPLIVSIVGLKDLCLQANGAAIGVQTCASGKEEQKWALYADGSVRVNQNHEQCLTSAAENSGTPITISSCSSASAGQRWFFTKEGSISNIKTQLVMEVKSSDPSISQIIINKSTGDQNQKWLRVF